MGVGRGECCGVKKEQVWLRTATSSFGQHRMFSIYATWLKATLLDHANRSEGRLYSRGIDLPVLPRRRLGVKTPDGLCTYVTQVHTDLVHEFFVALKTLGTSNAPVHPGVPPLYRRRIRSSRLDMHMYPSAKSWRRDTCAVGRPVSSMGCSTAGGLKGMLL